MIVTLIYDSGFDVSYGPPGPYRVTPPGGPWPKVCVRERGPGLSAPFVRPSCAPLRGSGPGSRRIRYADGRVRGRDRQRFRACGGSCQGATATPTAALPGLCRWTAFWRGRAVLQRAGGTASAIDWVGSEEASYLDDAGGTTPTDRPDATGPFGHHRALLRSHTLFPCGPGPSPCTKHSK